MLKISICERSIAKWTTIIELLLVRIVYKYGL